MRKSQFVVFLACAVAAPLAAQNSLPGLENFTLERPAPTPTATAAPPPAPAPTVTPPATPSPVPTATATPTPTTAPTAPRSRPSTSPSAQPTARPTETPIEATPVPTVPAAEPSAQPLDAAPPVTNTVAPQPSPEAAQAEPTGWSLWAALGALALVAVGAFLWWQRRDRNTLAEFDEIVPEPVMPVAEPAPPVVAQPQPAPAPAPEPVVPEPAVPPKPALPGGLVTSSLKGSGLVTSVLAPELRITITPFRCGADTLRATLEYEVRVDNVGRGTARDISVQTWMIGAGNRTAEDLITLFTSPLGTPMLDPFDLPASAAIDLSGVATVPRDMLSTINAGERRMFVPLLAVRANYSDGRGSPQSVNAAFLIGIERAGQDRLAPLPLDRGAHMHDRLAARPYGA